MAKVLTWKDLSETQLLYILQSASTSDARRFAQEQGYSIEKISTLISLVKNNHEEATEKHFTIERSWEYAKSLLLMHTVQRPPFSMALFSLPDLQMITQYLLHTYYKHYKLYQYAFTLTYILDVETIENLNFTEVPPTMPSLREASTQQERDADLLNLQNELEDLERKIRDSEKLAREAAITASIEATYRATIPEQVTQAAEEAVAKYMDKMRTDIEEKLLETEVRVTNKFLGLSNVEASNKEKPRSKDDKKLGTKGGEKEERKPNSKAETKLAKGI